MWRWFEWYVKHLPIHHELQSTSPIYVRQNHLEYFQYHPHNRVWRWIRNIWPNNPQKACKVTIRPHVTFSSSNILLAMFFIRASCSLLWTSKVCTSSLIIPARALMVSLYQISHHWWAPWRGLAVVISPTDEANCISRYLIRLSSELCWKKVSIKNYLRAFTIPMIVCVGSTVRLHVYISLTSHLAKLSQWYHPCKKRDHKSFEKIYRSSHLTSKLTTQHDKYTGSPYKK